MRYVFSHDRMPFRSKLSLLPGFRFLASLCLLASFGLMHSTASAESIAVTDGEFPGISVEISELKRTSGGTLTMKFRMINQSEEEVEFTSNRFGTSSHEDYYSVGGVHLIDVPNKKKYLVIRDSEKHCLCSRNIPSLKPGQSSNLWAKFPAPPEGVTQIGIYIPHFIPLDDVPISQ